VVIKYSSGFLVVSENLKQRLITAVGCPPSKIVVVTQPVEDPINSSNITDSVNGTKRPDDDTIDTIDDNKRIVLTVTNLRFEAKYRGVCDSLNAMLPLLRNQEDVVYIIVGGGAYYEDVVAYANRVVSDPEVRSRLLIPGYINKVSRLYRVADVFLYISYIDGYPNVVREAQLARLPVVATPGYGAEEQIHDGKDGFLIPGEQHEALRQRVKSLLLDDKERTRIGSAARERAVRENTKAVTGSSLTAALNTFINR
jgi:glycosyltransferase involved in cell wall biosynthesis